MSQGQLRVRDYKHSRRDALAATRARDITVALLVGLALGLTLWLLIQHVLHPHRVPAAVARSTASHGKDPAPAVSPPAAAPAAAAAAADGAGNHPNSSATEAGRYDFYQMLPKAQVMVSGHAPSSRTATASAVRPDAYFLQVGSYRDGAVAARVRAQVARLGIDATVQRVAVAADVWHRVRIGPIRDPAVLDRIRHQLQAGNLDSLIVRAED